MTSPLVYQVQAEVRAATGQPVRWAVVNVYSGRIVGRYRSEARAVRAANERNASLA